MDDDAPPDAQNPPDLNALAGALVEQLYDPTKLKRVEKALGNAGAYARTVARGGLYGVLESVLDWVGEKIESLEAKAAPILNPLLARVVGHTLGADVSTEAIRERTRRAGDAAIGKLVAETIFEILQGPGGELAPGDAAAKRMVGALGHMTINNWAEGIILEVVTSIVPDIESIDAIPELAKELINNTGISRLARTALRPLAHVLVATPLEWDLNKRYRPKLLSAAEAIRHYNRGRLDLSTVDEVLARAGYSDAAQEALYFDQRKSLSPADVALLIRSETWTRDQGLQELADAGYAFGDAARALQLEELKDVRRFQQQEAELAVAAFADHRIDDVQLAAAVAGAGLDAGTRARLTALANHKREWAVKHVSLAQAEQAVELAVWSETDYRDYLDRQGYSTGDAITLELMLRAKLNKLENAAKERAQIAASRAADKAAKQLEAQQRKALLVAEHKDFSGTLQQADRLVVRGLLSIDTFRQVLVDHGFTPADASIMASAAQIDADAYAAAQEKRAAAAGKLKRQELSLGALEDAVRRGVLSMDAFRAQLAERAFSPDDVQILVAILTDELAHLAAAAQKRDEIAARLAVKKLSLSDVELAVRKGVKTLDDYRAFLAAQGYSQADVATLAALLETKLADDKRAAEIRARADAKLAASQLSLATEEKAVVDGLKTLDDFRTFLRSHNFTPDDVATLVSLLELKLPPPAPKA